MKLRDKFIRFMYGRYGVDSMYKGMLILYLVLFVINLFLKENWLTWVMTALVFYMLFRLMSKNHIARAKENRVYLKLIAPFKNIWMRLRDIGKKRYRTCPYCKATVRLPIKRGKHTVKCPKCSNNFNVKIIL